MEDQYLKYIIENIEHNPGSKTVLDKFLMDLIDFETFSTNIQRTGMMSFKNFKKRQKINKIINDK